MAIAPFILLRHPPLDRQQLSVVAHGSGPMLILAGPGSGKTTSICMRAANLLATGQVEPQNLLLCTFTRSAALEMRGRLMVAARAAGYARDVSRVRVATIHGLCRWLLSATEAMTGARQPRQILGARDQLELLLVHHHRIFGPDLEVLDQYGWGQPQYVAGQARRFFDRIADECIDDQALVSSGTPFLEALGRSHRRYQQLLAELDAVDFGGLQREALLLLLRNRTLAGRLGFVFRHILVDEYQDTNFAQQEILFRLAEANRNICVVGDEDQLLYRFRGANPDGFGAFRRRFPDAATHRLTANYRSHRRIVDFCNLWIGSFDWSNPAPGGAPFRHPKLIVPRAVHANDNHPGVISVLDHDQDDEGRQMAELLHLVKGQGFIGDFDEAAVLLPSVKERYSRRLVEALRGSGIPVHLVDGEDHSDNAGRDRAADLRRVGHLLLTTIHRAKGREWPVVFVGGLHVADLRTDELEVELGPYLTRSQTEPSDRTGVYDLVRQYFVAFSRAQRLLVITAQRGPHPIFTSIWDTVPSWTLVDLRLLSGTGKFSDPNCLPPAVADGWLQMVVPRNATLILQPSSESPPPNGVHTKPPALHGARRMLMKVPIEIR